MYFNIYLYLNVQILPTNKSFHSSHLKSFQSVIHSKTIFSCILRNFIKIFSNQLLFLDKLDIGQRFCCQLYSLKQEKS